MVLRWWVNEYWKMKTSGIAEECTIDCFTMISHTLLRTSCINKLLLQSPYSPDLCDLFLFSNMETMDVMQNFTSHEQVTAETKEYFEEFCKLNIL
ncbi:hypothetical protein QE152_g3958 [Popillia japonica]|uniref:Uncharacterized protein n=1 Tax=Popillia japonica TaxID=7064 RepID=A0AAW1N0U7_POPJA